MEAQRPSWEHKNGWRKLVAYCKARWRVERELQKEHDPCTIE